MSRPSEELISSWLGHRALPREHDGDFWWRPGESSRIDPDDGEAVAEARHFRDVLGRFASGITVITGMDHGDPVGLTCQSFSSVSLSPPMVLFVPARTSRAWPLIRQHGRFGVSVLGADQADVSTVMASPGVDKFAQVAWHPGPVTGVPLVDGAIAHLECEVDAVHEGGDHHVVIGRVLGLAAATESGTPDQTSDQATDQATAPLLFYRGRYGTVGFD